MKTIDELLDDLEDASFEQGDNRFHPSGETEKARAAVDAKIKEMQDVEQSLVDHLKVANDRIAELEGEKRRLSYNLKIAEHRINRLDMIITENL